MNPSPRTEPRGNSVNAHVRQINNCFPTINKAQLARVISLREQNLRKFIAFRGTKSVKIVRIVLVMPNSAITIMNMSISQSIAFDCKETSHSNASCWLVVIVIHRHPDALVNYQRTLNNAQSMKYVNRHRTMQPCVM